MHQLPPAAEPPHSPAPTVAAAGHLVRVGAGPEGVAALDEGRFAVALRDPSGLALVDVRRDRIVTRVRLPGAARHLTGEGRRVLVPAETADRLLVVDGRAARIAAAVRVGRHPHDAAALAGGQVAVGNEAGNTLSVVRGDRLVRTLPVATQPGGVAAVLNGRAVVVVSVREREAELYDARTWRRVGRAPAGVGPTHVACLAAGPCYVTDTAGGALLVYRVRPRFELVRRLNLPGGPYGIALDGARRRLWVTLPAYNQLVELPAHGRPHVLARLPAVRQPDTVAVDERTGVVAVTGRVAGVLQLIAAR